MKKIKKRLFLSGFVAEPLRRVVFCVLAITWTLILQGEEK
jgi:hypothetical protein